MATTLKVDDWVRPRTGAYENELAQVADVEPLTRDLVTVRFKDGQLHVYSAYELVKERE